MLSMPSYLINIIIQGLLDKYSTNEAMCSFYKRYSNIGNDLLGNTTANKKHLQINLKMIKKN